MINALRTERALETRLLTQVELFNFRNFERASVELSPGLHLLVGDNAQGKTSFLESLFLLSTSRLLRGIRDAEAIGPHENRAVAEGKVGAHGATTIGVHLERGARKRSFLNGVALPRASDIMGRLPSVCVSAIDLPIVSGEPSERRMFLDLALSQIFPGYLQALGGYKRALEQRNALLKSAQTVGIPDELFEPWEVQMSEHGASIRGYRRAFVAELIPTAASIQSELGGGEALDLTFRPKDEGDTAEALFSLLVRSRHGEIARGTSQVGPHRDDVEIAIGGKDGRLYGSQGQQRSAVISLKLATHERVREIFEEPPLLLLDDMLSDLDAGRRAQLCGWVARNAGQAVLTCTEASAAGADILSSAEIFNVRAGTLERA